MIVNMVIYAIVSLLLKEEIGNPVFFASLRKTCDCVLCYNADNSVLVTVKGLSGLTTEGHGRRVVCGRVELCLGRG